VLVTGVGSSEPVLEEISEDQRAHNRRVSFAVSLDP